MPSQMCQCGKKSNEEHSTDIVVIMYVLQLDISSQYCCISFVLALCYFYFSHQTDRNDFLYRPYQGWLLSVLLHIQLMERSGSVHGGSVCDARVQR